MDTIGQTDRHRKKEEYAWLFCEDVRKMAMEYKLPFFIVTDGASATSNVNCEAVKNARDQHVLWEKSNGITSLRGFDRKCIDEK